MHAIPEPTLIRDLAVILAASGAVTVIFHRLRQPVVLGYLLAGVAIGPHTPPFAFVQDERSIHTLGELGVIFLLFSLGLEFDLRKLRRVGGVALTAALLEIPAMIWLGYSAGLVLGWSTTDSVFLGAMLSISSTTVIAKALDELGLRRAAFARIVMGILIAEDLVAIVILVVLSGLASAGSVNAIDLVLALGRVTVFVTCVVVLGLLTVPRLLAYLGGLAVGELLTVVVLGLCLGVAVLAGSLGFSVALGAFLMGAVAATSSAARQIEERIVPIRDLFSAVFFVAAGMLIDPPLLAEHWPAVVLASAVVVIGKVANCSLGTLIAGHGPHTATRVGMSLAQIGEFSFIIANLGLATGVMSPLLYPVIIGTSAATTLLTPYLVRAGDPVGALLERHSPRFLRTYLDFHERRARDTRAASTLARALRRGLLQTALYAALLVAAVVGAARVGSAVRAVPPTLFRRDAEALVWIVWGVVCLPIVVGLARTATEMAAAIAAATARPEGRTYVRDGLRLGLALVGAAFFLALGSPVLPRGLPLVVTVAVVGSAGFLFWRSASRLRDRAELTLTALLTSSAEESAGGGTAPGGVARAALLRLAAEKYPFNVAVEEVVLPLTPAAVHASIRELEIRSRTGATIAAVLRDDAALVNPAPETRLGPGDVLLLMGSREQVTRAVRYLADLAHAPPRDT